MWNTEWMQLKQKKKNTGSAHQTQYSYSAWSVNIYMKRQKINLLSAKNRPARLFERENLAVVYLPEQKNKSTIQLLR